MIASSRIRKWAAVTGLLSLLLGAAVIVWADFGMPGWFFIFSQLWLWTVGLPATAGVMLVTAAWGIPGWTALPLWLYLPAAALAGLAFQYAGLLAVCRLWLRFAGRKS